MKTSTAFLAAIAAVVAGPLAAQGISGGQIGIEYMAPVDGSDFGGARYNGGLEYAISRQFAVSADFSSYSLDTFATDPSSLTLHGIYHMNDTASVGAFFGQDTVGSARSQYFGVEGGTEFLGGEVAGYFAKVEGDSDGTMLGVDGLYAWRDGIGFTGNASLVSVDSDNISRLAVGASYQMAEGPEFYGEIGSLSADSSGVSDSQTFIGLGARINFGAKRGTTFDQRSLFETLPGY